MKEEDRHQGKNPIEDLLRMDRIPHIWCPGCGIGVVVTSFAEALRKSGVDLDKTAVLSGTDAQEEWLVMSNWILFTPPMGELCPLPLD